MYPKKWKRTKKVVSVVTAFAMLSSAMGTTAVAASVGSDNQPVLSEESGASVLESQLVQPKEAELIASDSQPVLAEEAELVEADSQPAILEESEPVESDSQPAISEEIELPAADSEPGALASDTVSGPSADATVPDDQPDGEDVNKGQSPDNSVAADNNGALSYEEVYNKMFAMQTEYPEGMTWNNFEPYGTKGNLGAHYEWDGGKILGNVNKGVGCAAFAFILSDAAFGNLQARVEYGFKFEDVKPGDILRINNDSHSVIVLQTTAVGVVVAEGNYNGTVHWGRAISKADVLKANFLVTRYPETFDSSGAGALESVIDEGTDGSLGWTLTNRGTLTIFKKESGSAAMRNFTADRPEWERNNQTISTVVIADGVESIGEKAFYNSKILSVSIPGTVKTIGKSAFQGCVDMISASIPKGVVSIGENAFASCKGLEYIDFPSTIQSIGASAFVQCEKVRQIRFEPGTGPVQIGDGLFENCWALENVILPEKADYISPGMFANCRNLSKLYLPAGIQFKEPNSGTGPFSGCTGLTEVNYAGSSEEWDKKGFAQSAFIFSGLGRLYPPKPNVAFPNPFAKDPNDPGDGMESSNEHKHSWAAEWNHDNSCHWHECTAAGCTITDSKEKSGYGAHVYGSWVTDVSATSSQSGSKHRDCTACAYRQAESIPATGSSSSGSSGGSWGWGGGSGGSWSSGSSNIPQKPSEPESPSEPDSSENNTGNTDQPDSNTKEDDSDKTDNKDDSKISASKLKQQKTKFKKEFKTGLKQQIKSQVKTELKKELKASKKLKSKAKLKKQVKAKIKTKVKTKLKTQMKKKYSKPLGDEFTELFNEQFSAQFNKVFSDQFSTQYKQLLAKQKKSK